jgi:surface antigen
MNRFLSVRTLILPLALCATLAVSACSTAAGASAPAALSTTTTTTSVAAGKVAANTASQAELQQAFTAAGISNPDRWAREVTEYRPYPTDDPTFAKLRGELAKYNPAPGVVDSIVATLAL